MNEDARFGQRGATIIEAAFLLLLVVMMSFFGVLYLGLQTEKELHHQDIGNAVDRSIG